MAVGRRLGLQVPQLVGRDPEAYHLELQRFLEVMLDGADDGLPAGNYEEEPETIRAGHSGAVGDPLLGWAPGSHDHEVLTGLPVGLGGALAEGSAADLARSDHVHFFPFPFPPGGTVKNATGVLVDDCQVFEAPWPCEVTNVRSRRKGGTGATVNMMKNGSLEHLAADLSLVAAGTTYDGGAVQNQAYVAGDFMEMRVKSVAGAPTEIAVWAYVKRTG